MIKIIFDGRLFDPVDVYGWGSGNRNVYNTKFDKLVSHVEQYKKSTVNKLEKNISQLLEIYGAE